ncbi:MAG TPA: alpha/beta hydrolase [Acidimicrobiales bacterium]|nr:alpha/beta hydrolase [Acidimicrobiales bacterium]
MTAPRRTRAVFVHGNPETAAIWEPMLAELEHPDAVTLSPPGFGAPVPDGFGATADDYAAWLAAELEAMGEPVDLVGHDWGGGHVLRIAIERPDLIRSWASDIAGCFAPDYTWHDLAQVWQTPGAGEEAVAAVAALPLPDRAAMYGSLGLGPDVAQALAEGYDADMGRCVLALYRSAAQPAMAQLGGQLAKAAARPGLVVIATDDGYTGGEARARWAAERAQADTAVLAGLGHWWMVQDPAAGARALASFWRRLDAATLG